MKATLSIADLRFINLVAARRFTGGEPGPVDQALESTLAGCADCTAFVRAATLAGALVKQGAVTTAPLQTALLAMHCSLRIDGLSLLAPQGVLAGMLHGLAAAGDVDALARWLEDRAVPAASGG